MDTDSGKVSKSAMERSGEENGVEVCTIGWLGGPRPSGQHASVRRSCWARTVFRLEEAGLSCHRSKSDVLRCNVLNGQSTNSPLTDFATPQGCDRSGSTALTASGGEFKYFTLLITCCKYH